MALAAGHGHWVSQPRQHLLPVGLRPRPAQGLQARQNFQASSCLAASAAAVTVAAAGFCRAQARRSNGQGHACRSLVELRAEAAEAPDRLVRYLGGNVSVRALCATELVRKVCGMHSCSPSASVALGRAVMATALLANGRDEGETLQMRIQGHGPIGTIIAEANSSLTCRGMLGNPQAEADSVPALVGVGEDSTIRVTRTHPFWKRPYTGTSALQCGEIAEDVVQYLSVSEQTPASMGLNVEWDAEAGCVKHAEGWLVTLLPGWDEGEVGVVEANIKNFGRMEASDAPRPDAICQHMMRELRGEFQAEQTPSFSCSCSKPRLASAVMMLGKTEVADILEKEETVEARCDWCSKMLYLTPDEVREHMLSEDGKEQVETRSASPRQMKLKEDELKEMPSAGQADWS
eukprot:TRINITY_DN77068_c0_g1_i1.p1 TRINITY_DN77068_c0_g1~~TRINITY_DN77068_c0_g1_i1.p1  ORF type:complete len:404 (-),score=92.49 TRINITY_DN77068_c0_g1_i1:13-1224(-)